MSQYECNQRVYMLSMTRNRVIDNRIRYRVVLAVLVVLR